MKGTGIFISKEELAQLRTEITCSGMLLSGGTSMGDPQRMAYDLTLKYKPPVGCAINAKTGEFMHP